MSSSGSNLSDTKDASARKDDAKTSPNEESTTKEAHTVTTVDISKQAGQGQYVKRPVEIVHEIPASGNPAAKKE